MKKSKIFVNAVLAGMFIGIGGTVFLSVDNKLIGSLLFSVGLFAICTLSFNLFTGKVCYVLDNNSDYYLSLPFIWFGNIIGAYLISLLEHFTRIYPTIHDKAVTMCQTKINDSVISIFFLAVLCNLLIYLAVEEYKNNPHETGKYLGIIFGVVVFIMCGFEHCVANMYYFSIADMWSFKSLLYIIIMTLGNALGGILIPLLKRIR